MTTGQPDPQGTVAADQPTSIQATDVKAWFGKLQALHGVNMAARERSVTAIIGPSGCGKSTLLRCLNRMHEEVRGARVAGQVLFKGGDIYAEASDPVSVRRRIGMVFQRPTPFPTMSIADNAVARLKLSSRMGKTEVRGPGGRGPPPPGGWGAVE